MTRILMVCLGNICRSPLAEGILRHKLDERGIAAFIDSAGTSNYHTGEHPDPRAIACARRHKVDISKLKARQFRISDFDEFDKIYVMDTSNYHDVTSLAKTETHRIKVELIMNAMYPDSNMNVPDPYYGGDEGFDQVFMMLDTACTIVAESFLSADVR